MSVDLEPAELGFRRPFTQEVSQTLHLRNPHNDPVAFKVKTTAPRRYCVRPNSGRIEPGKHVEVQVLLQAMKEDPPPDTKCRDKFLVQSVSVSADKEFSNVSAIWKEVEERDKSLIQERKIRVNFLAAEATTAAAETNGAASPDEEPPAYTSPFAKFDTPGTISRAAPTPQEPIAQPSLQSEKPKAEPATPSTTLDGSTSYAAVDTPKSAGGNQELKSELEEAKGQIQMLKDQLASQGLRLRKTGTEGSDSGAAAVPAKPGLQQQHAPSAQMGVPLQIVATLCLLSFLLAYIFF
ncbi:hypothetical protein AJ80_02998 [Polytolypa hystricis UAMH7299]|uniref:MSP domain-containing protein n=1 Tax=Polytolypa hystricis (strain UAMH7299) TaxID=1447883 RepID=A0A2B7YPH6_POLH7|nr:hypothetical protein AJ80_02998 [Polytolypa hystricis UAMH7299]